MSKELLYFTQLSLGRTDAIGEIFEHL